MSRKLKRVSLDFDWPLNEIWKGYLDPTYRKCDACDGASYTSARSRLQDLVRLILLSGADSLSQKNHPYFVNNYPINTRNTIPSIDMAELTTGLAGRSPNRPFGHDSIDAWVATQKIIEAAGLDDKTWGICNECKGKGSFSDDNWQSQEPPKGEGYQLWENVTEGSPISPIFKTLDKLCEWCEGNASTFASFKTTKEEWYKMLQDDNVHHHDGRGNIFI